MFLLQTHLIFKGSNNRKTQLLTYGAGVYYTELRLKEEGYDERNN